MRKIIQISAEAGEGDGDYTRPSVLNVLCDDGTRISIPSTLSVAKSIQLLKGNSSKWVHDTFKEHWDFEWQEGYGAFSIAISGVQGTTDYIHGQTEHHRTSTFREEIEVFLRKHGMEFVERDLA